MAGLVDMLKNRAAQYSHLGTKKRIEQAEQITQKVAQPKVLTPPNKHVSTSSLLAQLRQITNNGKIAREGR